MAQLLITNNLNGKRGFRKRTVRTNIRFGFISLILIVVSFFTLLSLLYLVHFNSASTKGYELNRLQHEREKLISEKEIQNMLLSEAQALSTIEKSSVTSRMLKVNASKITYMTNDTAIAVK